MGTRDTRIAGLSCVLVASFLIVSRPALTQASSEWPGESAGVEGRMAGPSLGTQDQCVRKFKYKITAGTCRLLWYVTGDGTTVDHLGNAVAVGDANGDGAADVLASGVAVDDVQCTVYWLLSGRTGRVLRSFRAHEGGYAAGAADFDGDGKQEAVLVAYIPDDPNHGGQGHFLINVVDPATGASKWKRQSPDNERDFGNIVDIAGDLNGDHWPDLLVSSVRKKSDNDPGTPVVYKVSGRTGKTYGDPIPRGKGSFAFGSAMTSAKLNSDSVEDIVIGDDMAAKAKGAVYAFSGGRSVEQNKLLWSAPGRGGFFGASVIPCPDLDSDSVMDLIAGAPYLSTKVAYDGSIEAISGKTGRPLWHLEGSYESGQFGRGLAVLGDVNADGVVDVAASAPANLPDYKMTSIPGCFRVVSGRDGSILVEVEEVLPSSEYLSSNFGMNLTAVDDVNGDGSPDLVVSAPLFGQGPPLGSKPTPRGLVAAFSFR